jgi:nucleoside-triphosphatase THEP1
MPYKGNNAFIISGKTNSGKTGLLKDAIPLIAGAGFKCGGILAEGIFEAGMKKGFNLVNISTGEKMLLCSDKFRANCENLGRFYFNPEAIQYGLNILQPSNLAGCNVIVIDEIGPLEISGYGWAPALKSFSLLNNALFIISVRESLATQVVDIFNFNPLALFSSGVHAAEDLASEVKKFFYCRSLEN